MRYGFGLNTDLLETNVLNLRVVVGIVVTVVGDAFRALLDHRRTIVLSSLNEANLRGIAADQELERARKNRDISRLQAEEIRNLARTTVEQENLLRAQNLEKDLNRIKENNSQRIQIERQRVVQSIIRTVSESAVITAQKTLTTIFISHADSRRKQKELNDIHVYETLRIILEK